MSDHPNFANTLAPRKRGFDLITTGPIDSLPNWPTVAVRGTLYLPHVIGDESLYGRTWRVSELQRIDLLQLCDTEMFKRADFREYLAERMRHELCEVVAGSAPINMHAEPDVSSPW